MSFRKPFFIIFFLFIFISEDLIAQLSSRHLTELKSKEDSLSPVSRAIVQSEDISTRFRSDSLFTRMLVRALKIPYSFDYPFDSLTTVSRLYAPDSSFRIFTWQVSKDENVHRRHGAIQIQTHDGSLKLFPLIDRSHMIINQQDTITNNEWWIGSIYYKIILKEHLGKKYYTLLGFDEHSIRSTKKRIEVLYFNEQKLPVFGGQFFDFSQDSIPQKHRSRYWIEYKKNGNARMLYDEEMDLIMVEHLISETGEPAKKYTLIPDGDYEGFKWIKGKGQHIEKVFTFKLEDGQAPAEVPLNKE
ncbi:MAG: hypothetical protein ACK5AO_02855 [bacterium]